MRWIAGGTYMGEALDFARQAFGSSQLDRKVAIVLTDGRSDTRRDAKPLSSLCSVPNIRLATCHHCSISSRHGLVYRESMAALSRNVMAPSYTRRHSSQARTLPLRARGRLITQRPVGEAKNRPRAPRPNPPEFIAISSSKLAGVKHFVFVHLRKLFSLGDTQRRRKSGLKLFS